MKPLLHIGFLQIPTFYLILCLTFLINLHFLSYRIEQNKAFDRKLAFDLILVIMISGFIGGRFFHVMYEEPGYYLLHPLQILQFWMGGFVYFGGMLAALLSSSIFLKYKKENFLRWGDFLSPILSLTYALGRLGCFFEGCCYGKFCDWPWAIHQKHPTQIYMTVAELFTFFIILKKKPSEQNGKIFYTWLVLHCSFRFVIEFWRDDDRGALLGNFLSVSQIICIIILAACFYLLKNIQNSRLEKN